MLYQVVEKIVSYLALEIDYFSFDQVEGATVKFLGSKLLNQQSSGREIKKVEL